MRRSCWITFSWVLQIAFSYPRCPEKLGQDNYSREWLRSLSRCRQLEPFFPEIRRNRNSMLVSRTMTGCMRRFGTPVKRKTPFTRQSSFHTWQHDFITIIRRPSIRCLNSHLFSRSYGAWRAIFPDKKILRNYRKISLRHSVAITPSQYSFFLPSHKGDRFFEGNTILIQKLQTPTDPYNPFLSYLNSRVNRFPIHPELWLTSRGNVPTRHWFLSLLRRFYPKEIAGF